MRLAALSLLLLAAAGADSGAANDYEAIQRAEHARWLAAGMLHHCDFRAYTLTPVEVRSAPRVDARVVGKLPGARYDAEIDADLGPEVEVREARDGWFRIRSQAPALRGWIPGRYLEFDLQTDKAFASPDSNAAVVAASWDSDGGRMPFTWREPVDCKGHWVKALFTGREGVERSGWAAGVCANQLTTCDGVYGEMLPYAD